MLAVDKSFTCLLTVIEIQDHDVAWNACEHTLRSMVGESCSFWRSSRCRKILLCFSGSPGVHGRRSPSLSVLGYSVEVCPSLSEADDKQLNGQNHLVCWSIWGKGDQVNLDGPGVIWTKAFSPMVHIIPKVH